MDPVSDFIYSQSENRKQIMLVIHELLNEIPGITSKIVYKIPFYYRKKWLCYLNPVKPDGVELAFTNGNKLSNSQGILQLNDRKQIAGITYHHLEEIQVHLLMEIIQEAILIDDLSGRSA